MEDFLDMCFAGLSIRPVTMSLVEHLMLDEPLTPEEAVNFGVDTQVHYRVLQTIVRDACREEELDDEMSCGFIMLQMHRVLVDLDRAMGDSAKLNEFVSTNEPGYVGLVQFYTLHDVLQEGNDTASKVENRKETSSRL